MTVCCKTATQTGISYTHYTTIQEVECMYAQTVIVKKCKSHRIGIVVFSALILAVLTACVVAMRTPSAILLYIPFLLILSPVALYYWTWQIRFEEKEIIRNVFGAKARKHSFAMLREVVKSYYISERNFTVRMYFLDGKALQFRMDDENAVQALKVLQRHCSMKAP